MPKLRQFENRYALLVADRRGAIPPLAVEVRIRGLSALPIVTDRDAALDQAMALAIVPGLSNLDALHPVLAVRESVPLASLDRRLNAAATAAGV